MYSRPPMGRFPKGMRVPENYSGNAFTTQKSIENEASLSEEQEPDIETVEESEEDASPVSAKEFDAPKENISRPGFKLDIGRFFSGNKSFGMEEFLIIALILLLAQNDTNDDTLIFLILLLFIR